MKPPNWAMVVALAGLEIVQFAAHDAGAVSEAIAPGQREQFVDQRDGQRYRMVEIGDATWLAGNLNYETPGSYCYGDQPANCDRHGRLYRWEAALSACPLGWHLSTEQAGSRWSSRWGCQSPSSRARVTVDRQREPGSNQVVIPVSMYSSAAGAGPRMACTRRSAGRQLTGPPRSPAPVELGIGTSIPVATRSGEAPSSNRTA